MRKLKKVKNSGDYWDVPRLAFWFFLLFFIGAILNWINRPRFLFLLVITGIIMLFDFFLCFYIMFSGLYYFGSIIGARCVNCGKKIQFRIKKLGVFLLTAPWKKRKVRFACLDCNKLKNQFTPSKLKPPRKDKKTLRIDPKVRKIIFFTSFFITQ